LNGFFGIYREKGKDGNEGEKNKNINTVTKLYHLVTTLVSE